MSFEYRNEQAKQPQRLADYHQRQDVLGKVVGQQIRGSGIVLFKKRDYPNEGQRTACIASVKLNINGQFHELHHINIQLKKNKSFLKLEPYHMYEFSGQVYRYHHSSTIRLDHRTMLASVTSYSLTDVKFVKEIDPLPAQTPLSLFQEKEARKNHISFKKLLTLPYGKREALIENQKKG